MVKPFIKWAGGKTQHLKYLTEYSAKKYKTYFEPFLGSGALYFHLEPPRALLSDSNGDLMHAFQIVRTDVESLLLELSAYKNNKDFYYKIRKQNPLELDPVKRAARFIYLNKTCYNGLYRVNSKNEFNVPFGNYSNPRIRDVDTLLKCSRVLNNARVALRATYYYNMLSIAQKNDFVYLDPPYFPLTSSSFVGYSKRGFDREDHENLARWFDKLSDRNVKILLSNSCASWVYERYKNYTIIEVEGRRSINSNGKGRGKIKELIIKNY